MSRPVERTVMRASPQRRNATGEHYHCPEECEHPQPFELETRRLCGRCWFELNQETEMVLCTPITCPDLVATETTGAECDNPGVLPAPTQERSSP